MSDRRAEQAVPAAAQPGGLGRGSIILLICIVLIAVLVGIQLARQGQTQPTSGPAPDFTLTTLDGGQIRLADLKGSVVVVNFWASWCVPCRDEAPALQAIWERYRDQGVILLGVAYTDTERGARAFMAEYGMTYPNGLDIGTRISEMYNITGVPETFIIDRNGEVARFYMVALTEDRLAAELDAVLQGST
jgi:cytochrome c biogenesis protein CcmG/thiol:disulfide interchange protein DsbE